jgi:hypothetical protein
VNTTNRELKTCLGTSRLWCLLAGWGFSALSSFSSLSSFSGLLQERQAKMSVS